ncbi:hypothetical protein V12B01_13670 [Vibrio splendidus 12B01]|nr:hypothetical protein V12B01_13670 [Vibrio splendidus 12B01]
MFSASLQASGLHYLYVIPSPLTLFL